MLKKYLERTGHICNVMNTNKNRCVNNGEFVPIQNSFDYLNKIISYCMRGYLIHMHINGKSTKSPLLAIAAEAVSLLFKRPAVLTFHAGPMQDYFPLQNNILLDSVFRLIFHMAGRIVCNNEEVKAKIVEYGISADKITPIPAFCLEYLDDKTDLPTDIEEFVQAHQPAVCSYIYVRSDFNIDFLLKSLQKTVRKFPDIGVILMGADKEAESLNKKIHSYGLTQNTYIAGDLDHGAFLAVLDACKAYIRTPVVDGVSSSVLEALLLDTEVVASENGSRPAGVITYEDNDVASFVAALLQALDKQSKIAQNKTTLKKERQLQAAQKVGVRDTLREEIMLLASAA